MHMSTINVRKYRQLLLDLYHINFWDYLFSLHAIKNVAFIVLPDLLIKFHGKDAGSKAMMMGWRWVGFAHLPLHQIIAPEEDIMYCKWELTIPSHNMRIHAKCQHNPVGKCCQYLSMWFQQNKCIFLLKCVRERWAGHKSRPRARGGLESSRPDATVTWREIVELVWWDEAEYRRTGMLQKVGPRLCETEV